MKEEPALIQKKIMKHIQNTEFGASASDIAKGISHNRVTVGKYLEILKAKGLVDSKDFAQAKIWNLNSKKKSKILIVDDEPHIVNLIKLSLDTDKYDLYEEFAGDKALRLMDKVEPDLLILDLMMPRVSGYDVLDKMKKDANLSKIPILILSAKAELDDKIKATDMGADDYLTKPFDPVEINERVKVMLAPLDVEQKIHPITGLLKEKEILSWVDKKIKDNDPAFDVISISLKNIGRVKDSKGVRSANEIKILISRLITQIAGKRRTKSVIGHTNSDKFVIVRDVVSRPNKDIVKEIKQEFDKMLPFIYHDFNISEVKNRLDLDFVKIKGKDIVENRKSMFDILG